MKLAICIPAFQEEKNIGKVIETLPKNISGIDSMKIFVVDDGSTDDTAKNAQEAALKFWPHLFEIVAVRPNQGLANAFFMGICSALAWGADFIVNIDADHQYKSEEIPLLLEPIIQNRADMVIGDRQVEKLKFMPASKYFGNLAGSFFIRMLTGTRVRDASSGLRAYSREAAVHIEIDSKHTYTHENLIQSHYQNLRIAQVPITFMARQDGTASRLITGRSFPGVLNHIFKSLCGIFNAWRKWRRKPAPDSIKIDL